MRVRWLPVYMYQEKDATDSFQVTSITGSGKALIAPNQSTRHLNMYNYVSEAVV